MFLEDIERDQWHEMGFYSNVVGRRVKLACLSSDVSSVTTLIIKELISHQNFIFTEIAIFLKP